MALNYRHFCPVARALEKIGDKWSLLIIRDLLPGRQRFTALLDSLRPITPKWLTQRLRELESGGIIEREKEVGRRRVWYQLTAAGKDLAPIVESLADWGVRYALRPPLPGETVHPDPLIRFLTYTLNKSGKRLAGPARWAIRFPQGRYLLSYDAGRWSSRRTENTGFDLEIITTPEMWATVFTAPKSERSRLAWAIRIEGAADRREEFFRVFGLQNGEGKTVSGSGRKKGKPKNSGSMQMDQRA